MIRIGHGYDVHKLVPDRKLILGGTQIEYPFGLLGHSDADVLTHAVMDALLGAAAMGDIGMHFPDTEKKWAGACSTELLKEVIRIIGQKGYKVNNIDSTIICQKPRLAAYIGDMRKNLADACGTDTDNISVKATTEEKLGFTGTGEGIAAHAVCTIIKN